MEFLWAALFSYLIGSIPTSWLIARWQSGLDIRTQGTGNAGASNVGLLLGTGWGLLVYVLDVLKGVVAALIGQSVSGSAGLAMCGLAAVVGHDFPITLWFRGGKGLATTSGVIWLMDWHIMLAIYGLWILGILITRHFIVSSMLSFVVLIILLSWLQHSAWYIAFGFLAGLLALQRHWGDLERIFRGEEPTVWERLAKKAP